MTETTLTNRPLIADKPETPEGAVRRALSAIKGSVVPQQVRLNHPPLRSTFKHCYEITDAHFYYAVVFCRGTLQEDVTGPHFAKLKEVLAEAGKRLDEMIGQMQLLADQNGVPVAYSLNEQFVQTQASTPYSKKYLDLFRRADDYMTLADALWIEGVIDDNQHTKSVPAMSQLCHGISRQVNEVFRALMDEQNKRRGNGNNGRRANVGGQDAPIASPSNVSAEEAANATKMTVLAAA